MEGKEGTGIFSNMIELDKPLEMMAQTIWSRGSHFETLFCETEQEHKWYLFGVEVKNAEHLEEIFAKEYSAIKRNKAAIKECKRAIEKLEDERMCQDDKIETDTKISNYRDILKILEGETE